MSILQRLLGRPPSPPEPVPVRPGAERYTVGDGRLGVLLCHGLTGSPQSMRGWADHLAAAGFRVAVPRLPGHGTSWPELNRTEWTDWYAAAEHELLALRSSCDHVFVGALSMGGSLALRLAALRPEVVDGLALVNPFVTSANPQLLALPVLRRLTPSVGGVVNDIARPGQDELGYDRLPLVALASLTRLWADLRPRLATIDQPTVVYRSAVDHVIDPSSVRLLLSELGSSDLTEVVLPRSYHVATMDYDAEVIFDGSAAFFRRLAGV